MSSRLVLYLRRLRTPHVMDWGFHNNFPGAGEWTNRPLHACISSFDTGAAQINTKQLVVYLHDVKTRPTWVPGAFNEVCSNTTWAPFTIEQRLIPPAVSLTSYRQADALL